MGSKKDYLERDLYELYGKSQNADLFEGFNGFNQADAIADALTDMFERMTIEELEDAIKKVKEGKKLGR